MNRLIAFVVSLGILSLSTFAFANPLGAEDPCLGLPGSWKGEWTSGIYCVCEVAVEASLYRENSRLITRFSNCNKHCSHRALTTIFNGSCKNSKLSLEANDANKKVNLEGQILGETLTLQNNASMAILYKQK